jgi:hypothetical protein
VAAVDRARGALAEHAGVREVDSSRRTGSLLIRYDPSRIGADALVDSVAKSLGLVVGEVGARPGDEDRLAYVAIDAARGLNTFAQELTRHRADLRIIVPAALAGFAAYSLVREGARLPGWDNLLYWSYSVFMRVNHREIERREVEADKP